MLKVQRLMPVARAKNLPQKDLSLRDLSDLTKKGVHPQKVKDLDITPVTHQSLNIIHNYGANAYQAIQTAANIANVVCKTFNA